MKKLIFRYKWYILAVFILMVADPTINSVLNFWLQRIFSAALPGADLVYITRLLTAGFLLWVSKRVVSFATAVMKKQLVCTVKRDMKDRVFYTFINGEYINLGDSGESISALTNDINMIETRLLSPLMGLMSGVLSAVILGTSFVALERKIAFSVIGFGMLAMFVPVVFSRPLSDKNKSYLRAVAGMTQSAKEFLTGYTTIKNYAIEPVVQQEFARANAGAEEAALESDYVKSIADNVGQLLSWFMQFIAVGTGVALVVKGEVTLATVIAAQSFASDIASPLQSFVTNLNSVTSVKELAADFSRDMDRWIAARNTRAENPGLLCSDTGAEIRMENLTIQMGENTIVDDFSFTFQPGKKYLITGPNGSSKTSVFRALKGWYPFDGKIYVDGWDVKSLNGNQLSSRVNYMNEKASLFAGTVRENITLFRPFHEPTLRDCVKKARVTMDTGRLIADEGKNISSGEARKIEIARCLYNKATGAIIMDEVLSTLDILTAYETEKTVTSLENRTVIFISHNFSARLIKEYDEILIMDKGRLAAHGSYDELLKTNEYFRQVCRIKFGWQSSPDK